MNEHSIATSNEAFEAMTPAEKRVILAQDVLKWIAAGRIRPEQDSYIYVPRHPKYADVNELTFPELAEKAIECEVCAKGGLIYAAFVRKGRSMLDYRRGSTESQITEFFSADQADAIEEYFEGWNDSPFYENFRDPADRLTALMQNIIDNDGEFVPDKLATAPVSA